MTNLWWELKHAFHGLARSPGSTAAIILTLGLGIGATLAIFSVVRATLIDSLPYERPDELLITTWEGSGGKLVPLSPAELRDLRRGAEGFSGIAAYHPWTFNVAGNGPAERLPGVVATAGLFEVLGVDAAIGRTFGADDTGAGREVILSDGLWRRRFGADTSILGEKLVLDGEPMTVVGVMPRDFHFPVSRRVELWRRAPYDPDQVPRAMRFLLGVGRLGEEVPMSAGTRELVRMASTFAAEYPKLSEGLSPRVTPVRDQVVQDFESNLLFLQGAVVLALLLACFNVSMVQIGRAEARRPEMEMRLALGARPRHILRLSLWESLLLGAGGSILGGFVAFAGVPLLVRFGPDDIHRLENARVGVTELGVSLGAGLLCALIIGQVPLWAHLARRWRRRVGGALRGRSGGWVRQAMVSVQVAVTLVLLLTFGLFLRSFHSLGSVDLGFDPDRVVALGTMLPEEFASLERSSNFTRNLQRRLRALPGVEAAATAVSPPMVRGFRVDNEFEVIGRPADPEGPRQVADVRPVSPGYFELLRIPVISGRALRESDDDRSRPVAVVNRTFARLFFEGGEATGEQLRTSLDYGATVGSLPHDEWEIVGVVGDVRQTDLDGEDSPAIYVSTLQAPWMETQVLVRASVVPTTITAAAEAVIRDMAQDLPVLPPKTLRQAVDEALGPVRFQSGMLGVFAGFALLLMTVGLYGTLSFSVSRRSREIGVRMALGAGGWQTRRLVVGQAMKLVVGGFAVGVVVSFWTGRLLSGFLFGVATTDPLTYAGVSVVVLLTSVLSCWLPTRRATMIDPAQSLRVE